MISDSQHIDGETRSTFLSRIQEKQTFFLVALLATGVVLTYWKVFTYPFVQDDLGVIQSFTANSLGIQLKAILSTFGKHFYRPVGELYLLVLYEIFGLNPAGYHVLNLLILTGASLLVVFVVQNLGYDKFLAWSTGFLYGIAMTIHMDPAIWIVGIFDIGGSFLFFLSILLFLRERTKLSIISFILALFTKESCVVLPFIIFVACLLRRQKTTPFLESVKGTVTTLVPYLVVLTVYVAFRIIFLSTPFVTDESAYRLGIGSHVVHNLSLYAQWLFQSFSLFMAVASVTSVVVIGCLLIIVLLLKRDKLGSILLIAWIIAGVAPALFIVDHAFRYYLVYVIPAFILLFLQCMQTVVEWFTRSRMIVVNVLLFFVLLNAGLSPILFSHLDESGLFAPPVKGWNNLIRKCILASMTKEFLMENFSPPSPGMSLVFDKRLIGPIGSTAGPQLWLGDPSLNVFDVGQVNVDSQGVYLTPGNLTKPGEKVGAIASKQYLDPQRTFFIILYQTPTGEFFIGKSRPPLR